MLGSVQVLGQVLELARTADQSHETTIDVACLLAKASVMAGLRPRTAPSFLSRPIKRKQKMAFDYPVRGAVHVFSFLMAQPVSLF